MIGLGLIGSRHCIPYDLGAFQSGFNKLTSSRLKDKLMSVRNERYGRTYPESFLACNGAG